jgi:6-phosphogluconate dehydrogenase
MPTDTADIGLIGLAVMGQNLVLNMNDHGYTVAVFNRTVSKVDDFINNEAKGTKVIGAHSIEEFVGLLKRPRRVMLMVKAGDTVDQMIDHVLPFLEKGDIIIDGGNSLFTDGAGHYVKMVHNGIEYGDMQLIGEAYQLLEEGLGLSTAELCETFTEWNKGELDSFLIEITATIFSKMDEDGKPMIDKILDTAGQKGTGKWTAISALDLGMPVTLIGEAVFARCLSAMKDDRVAASKVLQGPVHSKPEDREAFIEDVRRALYCSKMISYAQGYMLLRECGKEQGWNLNFGGIALMWRGGCIIRSRFLGKIKEAYDKNPQLANLLMDDFFSSVLNHYHPSWRRAIIKAIEFGVPTPAFSTALSFYDGFRTARLPANLLQAQRDFFGAHTYERIDKPRGQFFHTNWTGRGGRVSSSTYNA